MKNDSIREKGFEYSIRTAELVRYLQENGKTFPLCDRLLTCGLTTGLSCRELSEGEAVKEIQLELILHNIKEADYIIEMAVYAGYLTELQSVHIREEGKDLMKLLQKQDWRQI